MNMRYFTCLVLILLLSIGGATRATPMISALLNVRAMLSLSYECGKIVLGYIAGKGFDYVLGQDVKSQQEELKSYINKLEVEISKQAEGLMALSGKVREIYIDQIKLANEQLDIMKRLDSAADDIDQIRADQERLNRRLESFEGRIATLESQVDYLDKDVEQLKERVGLLEESMQSECLDLRSAPLVGAEGFRVNQTAQSQLRDHFNGRQFSLWLQINLNSCTAEMTQRGMLIQLALFTRKLNQEMSLYTTFKHLGVDVRDFRSPNLNHLQRLRFPLSQADYELDGQVQEFFLPYSEVPFQTDGRLALALVVAHDGQPIYSLSDRVISCLFGPRINCRWGN